ncbi:hypothetical protein E3P99_00641 [Wallemia hederae]|uniref:SET domain-containing protein n=1 Tax=Wallemia hederae TaxID=1540922 RepID=A0A4T0FUX8_9BASI|nr:hypothetical protein E3P99_00641 [Wallemia hederae]
MTSDLERLSECDSIISNILIDAVWGFTVVKTAQPKLDVAPLKDFVIDVIAQYNYNTHKLNEQLLSMQLIRDYLRRKRIVYKDLFKQHLHVYSLLFHPSTPVVVKFNSRLSNLTQKEEYCLIATRTIPKNTPIKNCLATLTRITAKQDQDLTDMNNDWSVLCSLSTGTRIFLGPARFANHDCDYNCQLERNKDHINLVTRREIRKGDEVLLNYGPHYFGDKNENCFCQTCEDRGDGAFQHLNKANENQLRTRFNSYIRSNTRSSTNNSDSPKSSASSSLTPLSSHSSLDELDDLLCDNDMCTSDKLVGEKECHTCIVHRRIYQNTWPKRSRLISTTEALKEMDASESDSSDNDQGSDYMSPNIQTSKHPHIRTSKLESLNIHLI